MQERAEACKGVHGACSDVQRHVKACIERAVACKECAEACRGLHGACSGMQRCAVACSKPTIG